MTRRKGLALLLAAVIVALISVFHFVAPPDRPLAPLTAQADHILVEKSARRMTLYKDGQALRSYQIALGFAPEGDKHQQGDGKTPEGVFKVDRRNPNSAYHLSLGIDYPQPQDRLRAAAAGVDPGGDIFIHGQPNALPEGRKLAYDWTAGCVAVSNAEMQEIYAAVPIGTTVEIRP